MANHFEAFPDHSADKPILFRSMYEKLKEAPEDSKKFQEIGLEFSPDGYIVTLKKQSPAESQFAKVIQEKGDEHYELDPKGSEGKFYVFAERAKNEMKDKSENHFDLAA